MENEAMPCAARIHLDRLSLRLDSEKKELVHFLVELAEFDRKKLGIELGYPSTLACLVGELALTESSACRRITAARLLTRFPKIADYLARRRLSLTALLALKEILDEENHADLLERAAGLSEPEVRALVRRAQSLSEELPGLVATGSSAAAAVTPVASVDVAAVPAAMLEKRGEVIREESVVLTLRVSGEFAKELARVRDLASHSVPSGKAEEVLLHVLRAYRKTNERRRFGSAKRIVAKKSEAATGDDHPTEKPSNRAAAKKSEVATGDDHPAEKPSNRAIPATVKRDVYDREQGSCAFVGPEGKRCGSTWQIEYQHIVPFARGGEATRENTTIYCKAHNQLAAEKDFGVAYVAARRWERREPVLADVGSALRNLGFGQRQAKQAVTKAWSRVPPDSDFVTLLREGLKLLTRPSTSAP